MRAPLAARHTAQDERTARFRRVWASPTGWLGLIREVNNIPIARRYMAAAFAFFLLGGILALLLRVQLARSENSFLGPEAYNQIFTMHGTTMMFLFVIPFLEAVATYLLPLQLGTRELPFPRLTALSFWTYVFGGLLLYSSFFFGLAPDGGWFAYVPLTGPRFSPGLNLDFWDIALGVAEIAAMGAAAELIVSVLRMRAPGMAIQRIPVFAWAILVTAVMILFAFTPLIVGTAMLELDRKGFTAFFDPDAGGDPLLWQHLFWAFGHPEVYIMFLPAVGIVSHVVQVFARRPLAGYTLVVLAILATGVISFGLWVHHMFAVGISPVAMGFFTAASMMVAIPSGIQVFSWIATLWTGRPLWRTPLLFAVGTVFIFVLGGLTGVMLGAVPFDQQAHDSFFVVAHLHYVLIGGVVFPLFAGLYYWLPKIMGRMLSERIGRWNFCLMFSSFQLAFFPMHIAGLLGMPRRIYTYQSGLGWDTLNLLSTIGAFGFASGVALLVVNVLWSRRRGAPAGNDPWRADTLEWSETSPPAAAQFEHLPVVRGRHPLWEQDSLAATDPETERLLRPLQAGPADWRGALVVTVLDARPLAIVHVPGPGIWPFVMAVGFLLGFTGALLDHALLLTMAGATVLVALGGWFWPQASERMAIAELGNDAPAPAPDQLPLAVAGPRSNGWWGTMVLIVVLTTALATILASYFYLGAPRAVAVPARTVGAYLPWLATSLMLAAGALTLALAYGIRRRLLWLTWVPLSALFLLHLAFATLSYVLYDMAHVNPASSGPASAMFLFFLFQWLIELLLIAMLGVALLWAWLRPGDPRGHAVALNASLVNGFAVVSWHAIFVVLYLAGNR